MTDAATQRLTEVKFYYLIHGLFKMTPNVDDVLALSDILSLYNGFNKLSLQGLILKNLDELVYKPTLMEAVVLYWQGGYPIRTVCKLLKISNNKFYEILYTYKEDPFTVTTRNTPEKITDMAQFIIAYEKLISLGGVV